MPDKNRLFSEPKPEVFFPVDIDAELRAKEVNADLRMKPKDPPVTLSSNPAYRKETSKEVQYGVALGDHYWESNHPTLAKGMWRHAGTQYALLLDTWGN